jgi:NADH:ubiquinone oxidoreductase subunit K
LTILAAAESVIGLSMVVVIFMLDKNFSLYTFNELKA